MTPSAFISTYLSWARKVESDIGVDAWAVLTQWAFETGWGTSALAVNGHNLAGIKHYTPGTTSLVFWTYPSVAAFVTDYENTLRLSYYTDVLAQRGKGTVATLYALGRSPWDAGHYGSPAGTNVVNLWNGTIAPLAGVAPTPTAPPPSGLDPTALYAPAYVAAYNLGRRLGLAWTPPPWAAAQSLPIDHLGVVPDLVAGANYLAVALHDLAKERVVSTGQSTATLGIRVPPWVPAGTTGVENVEPSIYVGLVDLALALNVGVTPPPWITRLPPAPFDFGVPTSWAAGMAYITAQLNAMLATGGGTLPPPTPPPVTPPVTPPPTEPPPGGSGTPPPLPPPLTPPGPGVAGLLGAWDQLRTEINVTLPGLAERVTAAIAALGGRH